MPRRTRTHIGEPDNLSSDLKPKHLTKQEFARRLYKLMISKGWNQSELARQAGLNRDAVSTYMNARVLPTPQKLAGLAEALGVASEVLLPNHAEAAIDADNPSFEMKVSANEPGTAWLRVNRMVTTSTAVKIAELLQSDDVINRT